MSKSSTIRIVGAVLDNKQLLLYREDGTTVGILQGDPRLQTVLYTVVPQINLQGWAEIPDDCLDSFSNFEKKTGIQLFRVLKDAVKQLFSTDEERSQDEAIAAIQGGKRDIPKLGEGLLFTARPIAEDSSPIQYNETVVALVGNNLVPGMEMLKGQFDHIQKNNSEKGVKALIDRLSVMIENRGHSVEDILKFLERGDLPIADDGSIIAYKVLSTTSYSSKHSEAEGVFFDCHTHLIPQQVGSYVTVDESLVDKNRRNECSNGLHIARRGYIKHFPGDVLVLCKIAPEDVITVPHEDPNKVRVCGYHIIAQISQQDHETLREDRPMTDNDNAQILLAKAIAGDHIGKTEEVRITGQKGSGIVITNLMKKQPASVSETERKSKSKLPKAKALSSERDTAPDVDPKELATAQAELKTKNMVKVPSRSEQAQFMFKLMMDRSESLALRQKLAHELLEIKKRAKSSWDNLGFEGVDVPALITKTMQEMVQTLSEKHNLTDAQHIALKMVREGKSKLSAERITGISARSIGRLLDKFGK